MMFRIKLIKFKFFCFILGSVLVYLILLYSYLSDKFLTHQVVVNLKYVVVHIDLKGAPPRLQYLENILPFFKKYGVNGILMEYEDMFPYKGNLVNLSSKYRYNRNELRQFLLEAKRHEIEIIPLIQTFAHMEHILKLKENKHLREMEEFPDSICPSKPESIRLITNMLKQVINFHANISHLNHIHIGCDEVYHINTCQKCTDRRISNAEIFTKHVIALKDIIARLSPSTTVLVWDDMIRNIVVREWSALTIETISEVEPVYWDYTAMSKGVSHFDLYLYHKTFKEIWISTAFKGADGRQASLPNYEDRILNHYSWLSLVTSYITTAKVPVNIKGIIITGWSRYSHMDPLCELLPPSLPSLILNLILIRKFRNGLTLSDTYKYPSEFIERHQIFEEFSREFSCSVGIEFHNLAQSIEYCESDSKDLVLLLRQHKEILRNIEYYVTSEKFDLSAVEYYSKMNYLNMNNLKSSIELCQNYLKVILTWEENMQNEMLKYYDKFVIDEYVGSKIYAMKNKLNTTLSILEEYSNIRTWERQPQLPYEVN